mgnify:CR=1 FL=1
MKPGAERLYGYGEREAVGPGLEAIVPEEDMDATRSLLERARRGERIAPQRVRRRTRGGKALEACLTLSLLVDYAGAPKALSTIELPVQPAPQGGASE